MQQYDLNIVVPVSVATPKYRNRLEFFRRFGLMNVGSTRLLLTLLIGTEAAGEFCGGWPTGVEVVTRPCESDDPARKVYAYFSGIGEEAEWVAKFDDDSVNDVSGLVASLRQRYSPEVPHYLVTWMRPEVDPLEFAVMDRAGVDAADREGLRHEHEGSIASRGAIRKITGYAASMALLGERAKVDGGYTDQCLAFAAKIAGVKPVRTSILCSKTQPAAAFSLFGGWAFHFHPLCPDKTPKIMSLLARRLEQEGNPDPLHEAIGGRDYVLSITPPGRRGKLYDVRLSPGNGVFFRDRRGCPNECLWFAAGRTLELYSYNGERAASFPCDTLLLDGVLHAASGYPPGRRYAIYSKI